MARRVLLTCGILSSLYYTALNIYVPTQFPGYHIASQTVSELSAIGAPTRPLWVWLCSVYSLLVIAFSGGIWQMAAGDRRLKITALLMFIYGISGFFWPPMHLRGNEFTLTDMMHIIFAMLTIILMILMMGFGAAALGKGFLVYTIITLFLFIIFGTLTGIDGPKIEANLPTPWIGVWERINIGLFLLWMIVFARILLHYDMALGQQDRLPSRPPGR